MAWREGHNLEGPIASASKSASFSSSSSSGTAAVGLTCISSIGGSIGPSLVVDSTLCLLLYQHLVQQSSSMQNTV